MGAVSLAQRGGILGSGIYATQKPNVDVAGAIGAISQALSAQREGAIQRAYLQHQTARQKELDDRALQQQLYERGFQSKQLAQQQALAQGQHELEARRIESDADLKRQEMAAAAETKRQQLQMMKEIAQLRATATTSAAKVRADATTGAARIRGPLEGNNAAMAGQKDANAERLATSKDYSTTLTGLMKPTRNDDGSYTKGMTFEQADPIAKRMMREAHPSGSTTLWGAPPPPLTTTAQGELDAQAQYRHAYDRLDPKDPNFPKQKASLDNALMDRLNTIHSAPPQPITPASASEGAAPAGPASVPAAGAAPAPAVLPNGDPSDNDQEP